MSERDREPWDPKQRRIARLFALMVGVTLTLVGAVGGTTIIAVATIGDKDVSMLAVLFTSGLVLAGLVCLVPNVAVPIAYRLIDKFGKDSTGPEYKDNE